MGTDVLHRPSHDEDFHAWALDQARRLRALAPRRADDAIDWHLVAEEIEDTGKRERRGAEAFLKLVIVHLLRLEYGHDPLPRRHWRAEVAAFRKSCSAMLTPSLRALLRRRLADIYDVARAEAYAALAGDPEFDDRTPDRCPYTWEQITGDWLPDRAAVDDD